MEKKNILLNFTYLTFLWPLLSVRNCPFYFTEKLLCEARYDSFDVYPFPLTSSPWFFARLSSFINAFFKLLCLCGNTRLPCVVVGLVTLLGLWRSLVSVYFYILISLIYPSFNLSFSLFHTYFLFSDLCDIFHLYRGVCYIGICAWCIFGFQSHFQVTRWQETIALKEIKTYFG